MIKIFILNIVVVIIQFVSVETTSWWNNMVINSGNSYDILTSATINSFPEFDGKISPASSNNNSINSTGITSNSYKTKICNFLIVNLRIIATDFGNRFKYFESGISPPNQFE